MTANETPRILKMSETRLVPGREFNTDWFLRWLLLGAVIGSLFGNIALVIGAGFGAFAYIMYDKFDNLQHVPAEVTWWEAEHEVEAKAA